MAGEGEEVFLGHELQARASGGSCIGLGILVLSRCRGKVRESGVCEQFALYIFIIVVVIGRVMLGEFCLGKMVLSRCRGEWQFALIMIVRIIILVVLSIL